MKTDKELLKLAAKAVGIKLYYRYGSDVFYYDDKNSGREEWAPLEDDGQALRLAVDLKLRVDVSNRFNCTAVDYFANEELSLCEYHGHDGRKATRRAIVRAAAAIGEAME